MPRYPKQDVRRVGTALIGGNLTGNVRGTEAIDIQTSRTAATQVASGQNAIAIGGRNTVSSYSGYPGNAAIGFNNTVIANYGNNIAIGVSNTLSGYNDSLVFGISFNMTSSFGLGIGYSGEVTAQAGTAAGYQCSALSNEGASAFGYKAEARIERTTNICGPQIIRKDDGEAVYTTFYSFCGVEVILTSKEIDMKVVADQTITLPANCHFWLNEIGIIATDIAGLVAQPTVRYGITGDLDKHNAAAITTDLTATYKREIEIPLVPEDGETSLTGGVTIAANATTFKGRFYWKGMLIEDE